MLTIVTEGRVKGGTHPSFLVPRHESRCDVVWTSHPVSIERSRDHAKEAKRFFFA